jgi:hypothetical protein
VNDLAYSESITAFAPAFVTLQHRLPKVVKTATGQVGQQKTRYADFEAITDAIKDILHECGFAYLQPASGGHGGQVSVTTILLHTSGEWMRDTLSMPTGGNGAQGVGSALTYAKRYGLASILGIATEDDDGHAASQRPPAARQPAAAKPDPRQGLPLKGDKPAGAPSQAVTKRVMAMFAEAGITDRAVRLQFTSTALDRPVASWSEVNASEAHTVMDVLDRLIKGQLFVVYMDDGGMSIERAA